MERKTVIERNGKKYFMDIIFKQENYLNYPYVSGYYLLGTPMDEEENKLYEFQRLELLFSCKEEDENNLATAKKVADMSIDNLVAQINQDMREKEIKDTNSRKDIDSALDTALKELEDILNPKDDKFKREMDNPFTFRRGMFGLEEMDMTLPQDEDRLSGIEKCKYYMQPSDVTFDDIAGMIETKEEVLEAIDLFRNKEKYEAMGIKKTLNNIMLSGASGCGKTLIVKAISNELGLPIFSTSGDVSDKYVGTTSRNIETLFKDARKYEPSIIFIDEFEAMARTRTGESNNQEREGGVSTLLAQLDGLGSSEDVMVIVATNLPDVIDPAVQRRFPTKINISNPDYETRLGILQINSRDMQMEEDCNLEKIARNLSGFNGGDIAQIMQSAGILAVRRGKEKVSQEELEDSMERVICGLKSKTKKVNEEEKSIIAHHEISHAILTYILKDEKIQKISIIPTTGSTLGYVMYANEEDDDRFLSTKEDLLGSITVSLGGRAGEEIVFGKVTGGCSNDLEKATRLAENMVTRLGMCEGFGLMSINPNDAFMRKGILAQVKVILDECYIKALKVLKANKVLMEELSKVLIEKEVMNLKDFEEVVERIGIVNPLEDDIKA